MALVAQSASVMPKREAPIRTVDLEEANAILAILTTTTADGIAQIATDDELYADVKKARATSNKYRRLVTRVVPAGQVIKTRVWEDETAPGNHRWSIYLATDKKAEKKAATTETPAATPAKSK